MPWGSRRLAASLLATLTAGCLAVAASGTGTTYAAFSDFKGLHDNHVGAATVAVGIPGPSAGPKLAYAGLVPGVTKTDSFDLVYRGNIPGDVALEIRPDGGSPYCVEASDGSWTPKPGGQVQIDLGSGWTDYCSLLQQGVSVPVRNAVAPGTDLTVSVSVRLAPGTDYRYSQLADTDRLTITARQASATTDGFTDFADGTISVGAGAILPLIPARCGTAADYPGGIVYGTEGPDHLVGGNQGQIIFGLGGDDILIGGNAKDCLVGGPGNDQLWGNNGKDAIDGGEGDDILIGGNGADDLYGGDGNDICYGGSGPDDIDCETSPGGDGPAPPAAPVIVSEASSAAAAAADDPATGSSQPTGAAEPDPPVETQSVPGDSMAPGTEAQQPAEEPTVSTS